MIVPRARLIVGVAVFVLPLAALAALPSAAPLAGGLIATFFSLVMVDALLGCGRLDGIDVELPEVARLVKDREGSIELRVINETRRSRYLRLGLAWPLEVFSPNREMVVLVPGQGQALRMSWPCTAFRRGRHVVDRCRLEVISHLGFWGVWMTVPARIEIQVYPNLTGERRNLAAHFLKRGQLGIHAQRQVGMGRDFERLREYIPGDSYDEIHWKATAKRRYPITKVFQIERTQDIYVVIDASRLSARKTTPLPRHRSVTRRKGGGSDPTILERFVTAALIMALIAERQGDLFGILTFNDKIRNFVRAKGGKAHYNACRDALYTLQSEDVTPDFDELFTFIGTRLRRRALLLFLTSLDDEVLAESFVRKIDVICRRHLVLVNMLRPPGARPLFSDPEVGSVDDLYRHLSGHFLWAALRELEKVLQRRGVRLSLLDDERICPELVSLYLGVKQRQLL